MRRAARELTAPRSLTAWPAAVALVCLIASCAAGGGESGGGEANEPALDPSPKRLTVEVRAAYPHDPEAWTQGLVWHQGALFESLGLYGRSRLRQVALATGEVESEVALPREVFAEGLELHDGVLHQLSWHAGRGFRWSVDDLAALGEFRYAGQGWGLCVAGEEMARSDGTARLTFHRVEDFRSVRALEVTRDGRPQGNLNELECVDGWIYANVWMTDEIVRIDPTSGLVDAVIDASGLLTPRERETADVLNGIAYHPENRTFLLTGKHWPKLFEVAFVEAKPE